ncbi:cupin-like domain-containing protein [Arthrospira platensis SPKY2]
MYNISLNNHLQLLKKIESMLVIQTQLSSLTEKSFIIDQKSNVSKLDFLDNYYSKNIPLIFTNLINDWPALKLWTPEYLKKYYGHINVEIQTNRDSDPQYEINQQNHKQIIPFAHYISWITSGRKTNNYYMVANNRNLERPEFKPLLNDLFLFPQYLETNFEKSVGSIFFWYGPEGTITPLHHDPVNLLLAQVSGTKLIRMIPPYQIPFLYNFRGVFSMVDLENPDYNKYPLFKKVKMIEFILEPGDVLFIPVGWWHHIRSLQPSISVSMTNFLFPNNYHWDYPNISF